MAVNYLNHSQAQCSWCVTFPVSFTLMNTGHFVAVHYKSSQGSSSAMEELRGQGSSLPGFLTHVMLWCCLCVCLFLLRLVPKRLFQSKRILCRTDVIGSSSAHWLRQQPNKYVASSFSKGLCHKTTQMEKLAMVTEAAGCRLE